MEIVFTGKFAQFDFSKVGKTEIVSDGIGKELIRKGYAFELGKEKKVEIIEICADDVQEEVIEPIVTPKVINKKGRKPVRKGKK